MFEFTALNRLYAKIEALDENRLWIASVDVFVQDNIIRLNTQQQLGEDGVDSLGESLGDYAPFTVLIRESLSLQTSHIDFKMTGDYWESWDVTVNNKEIIIESDPVRFNELVAELNFSEDHVGLTAENMQIIKLLILTNIQDDLRKELLS